MNKDSKVHVVTGVWYEISFGHKRYHHFPCHIQYDRYTTGSTKYISALESCEPVMDTWGAKYDVLNGAKPRSTRELIDLTKGVCAGFLESARWFTKIDAKPILLPMISISMERLISGATYYQGKKNYMKVEQDDKELCYFIYSKVDCLVTPSNISDVLNTKIKHIHVINWKGISWRQESKLDPNTSLYVYNYDKYEDGCVYVEILHPKTEVVNENLCLISPEKTKHIPSKVAELFRQKTAPIRYNTRSQNR